MIEVLQPGLLTTVQDTGRWGYQAFGMPVAGAMDRYAYRAANLLVGNDPEAAALEMTLKGGQFRFAADCYFAICGADMQATLNGQPVANWACNFATAGSELSFEFAITGCRAYLAIQGGIDVPVVMGSRSTYVRAAVGGYQGRALKAGDVLPAGKAVKAAQICSLPAQYVPPVLNHIQLRVLPGPQDDYFTAAGLATFFSQTYTITAEADRMGYRLDGPVIEHCDKADIISDALCQGAIQVPGHGRPIIMMADRHTTGGYVKLGAVIGSDLRLLGQAKPGDEVSFVRCNVSEAEAALAEEKGAYAAMEAALAQTLPAKGARSFTVTVNSQVFKVQIEEVE